MSRNEITSTRVILASMRYLPALLLMAALAQAQNACPDTPLFRHCDIVLELNDAEAAQHAQPWRTVQISAEVKSPRFRTFLAYAFWDGGRKLVLRVTPTDEGLWELRLTSNIARLDKQLLQFQGVASEEPGFIQRANVHHWRHTGNRLAHLWLGTEIPDLATAADEALDTAKAQGATHVRSLFEPVWPPQPERFRELEQRVLKLNQAGIIVDLMLAGPNNALVKALPDWTVREQYFRYLMARLAPLNVTWELVQHWETYDGARGLLKDLGALVQKLDPYNHPRSAYPQGSTSAFVKDGWMTHLLVNGEDPALVAIEHQLYPLPLIAVGRKASPKILWEAITAGSYPGWGITKGIADTLAKTRYWELEPFFDVSNGRAVALTGVEYLVWVERPAIVEVDVEKHTYDAAWVDAATGERVPLKEYKGEHFIAEPPAKDRLWLLHLSREGRKAGMLTSYKFESRPNLMQEIEMDPKRVPFDFDLKENAELKAGAAIPYKLTISRDTRATRFMQYLVTADVPTEMNGARVITTRPDGSFVLPAALAQKYPAVLYVRVNGLNANGKLYSLDRVVRLVQ